MFLTFSLMYFINTMYIFDISTNFIKTNTQTHNRDFPVITVGMPFHRARLPLIHGRLCTRYTWLHLIGILLLKLKRIYNETSKGPPKNTFPEKRWTAYLTIKSFWRVTFNLTNNLKAIRHWKNPWKWISLQWIYLT